VKAALSIFSAIFALGMPLAHADQSLAMQSGCLGCHKADAKLVGPSFQDIAAKYKDDPSSVDRLATKVKNGSPAGEPLLWGQVPMPASPAAPENIKTVIQWMFAEGSK
jgi:cytochrome c